MKKIFQRIKDWTKVILIAFVLAILIKAFVFESDAESSNTMETSLYKGDYVFVSKLTFGPRAPVTLLSLPFCEKKIPFTNCKSYFNFIQLPAWRIPGFSNIKRNDVLAFNYPEEDTYPVDKRSKLMMRCAAVPGDSIKIEGHKLFINGFETKLPASVHYTQIAQENSTDVFPQSNHFPWMMNNFGPLWIPGKGKTVKLTLSNFELYKETIENEGNYFEVKGNKFYINNSITYKYTFKQNYYFMLDDNRDFAKDSRYWGFLPENHVIGKCIFVWFSVDKDNRNKLKTRWERMLKAIN